MFCTTRLSIHERYRRGGEEARQAVAEWYDRYRAPMCQYVRVHFRRLASEVEDVVQGFISGKVLIEERSLLIKYRPELGTRFRTYLQIALKRYCLSILKGEGRRGTPLSLDEEMDSPGPEDVDPFEVIWARQVVGRALRRMKAACDANPKLKGVWGILKGRLLRPFRGKPQIDYDEIVELFGYDSPPYAQKDATKAKRMLGEALTSVVSEYEGADAARSELMDLWRVIRRIREHRQGRTNGCSPDQTNKE